MRNIIIEAGKCLDFNVLNLNLRLGYRWLRLRVIAGDEAPEDSARADETGAGKLRKEGRNCHQKRRGPHQSKSRCYAQGTCVFACVFSVVVGDFISDLVIPSLVSQASPEQLSIKDALSPRKSSGSPKHKSAAKGQGSGKKEKKAPVSSPVSESAR